MYSDDKLWVGSKRLAKLTGHQNDWTAVITIYNVSHGKRVKLYVLDSSGNYFRVIGNTDKGNTVLLNESGTPFMIDTETVVSFKKFFDYSRDINNVVLKKIKVSEPVQGKNEVEYYE